MRLLASSLLALLVAGCSWLPVQTHVQYIVPPGHLLVVCREPEISAITNGDLANAVLALRDSLNECRAKDEELLRWSAETVLGK